MHAQIPIDLGKIEFYDVSFGTKNAELSSEMRCVSLVGISLDFVDYLTYLCP